MELETKTRDLWKIHMIDDNNKIFPGFESPGGFNSLYVSDYASSNDTVFEIYSDPSVIKIALRSWENRESDVYVILRSTEQLMIHEKYKRSERKYDWLPEYADQDYSRLQEHYDHFSLLTGRETKEMMKLFKKPEDKPFTPQDDHRRIFYRSEIEAVREAHRLRRIIQRTIQKTM